jgi:hypothetical protein
MMSRPLTVLSFHARTTRRPSIAMPRILLPLALAALLGLSGCSDSPSVEQCEDLLSHIVEIEVRSAADDAPRGARADELEQQKAEIKEYLGEEFVDTCRQTYSRERIECALAAGSYEELVACAES